MITFNDFIINEAKKSQVYKYGCSMVFFNSPAITKVQKAIDPSDLYTENDGKSYGLESEHHTTLLYGLHDDEVDENDVMRISAGDIPPLVLTNASAFENAKYGVLKFDVKCDKLHEINGALRDLPHTNEFPDYHPHATIAYLKPGVIKKYIEKFKGIEETVKPTEIVYSKANGTKIRKPL